MQNFVSSVVSRLADLIEFTDAALTAEDAVRRKHFATLADQEIKMEQRLARALGVEHRAIVEGIALPWEDAESELRRRRTERKRLADKRARDRAEALEMREEQFA